MPPMNALPLETPKVDAHVLDAVRRLVRLKDEIDGSLTSPLARALLPAFLRDPHDQALSAVEFVQAVLPFVSFGSSEERLARYPADLVLAEPWKWREPDPGRPDPTAMLADDDRARLGADERAEFFLVEPFGLAFPHEGKNRVLHLRSKGFTSIPCALTMLDYPAPGRLCLYRVNIGGIGAPRIVCVLDGRYAQEVPVPGITLPLLSAYGVADMRPWPASLPQLGLTLPLMDLAGVVESPWRKLDLGKIEAENERAGWLGRQVPTSVLDLDLGMRMRPLLIATAVVLVACTVAAFLPQRFQTPVGIGIFAFVAGVVAALRLRWWAAPNGFRRDRMEVKGAGVGCAPCPWRAKDAGPDKQGN